MGSTTPSLAIPYPVGTDRVMDGDNAMQSLAERVDLLLGGTGGATGGTAPVNAPGQWQAATPVNFCNDTSSAVAPGTTITEARWMKIGKTVWFVGYGTTTTSVTNVAILLPAAAGVPNRRFFYLGPMFITGASAPVHAGVGVMSTDLLRAIWITNTNAYVASGASSSCRWSIMYEVN